MALIRVVLGDDHNLVRQGVRRILESDPDMAVVGEASSGVELIELAAAQQPSVAIVDIGMQGLNGIEATPELLKRSPRTSVLILSMFRDEKYVIRAVKAGATGYLVKDSVENELLHAVRVVHGGQSYFSPVISKLLVEGYARELKSRQLEDRFDLLTDRERQVYALLAEGKTNKEIATIFNLSTHTVETHRLRLMEKLDLHNAVELVLDAVRRGMIVQP